VNDELKSKITTPALVLDKKKLEKNIKYMANFAKDNNIKLRPHVKTHKCPIIGKMQLEAGAIGITVAKVSEAEVFVKYGFNDILIANEIVSEEKIINLLQLAKNNKITVAVDSIKNIKDLDRLTQKYNVNLNVLIDINVGLDRTGVKPGTPALELGKLINNAPLLRLEGLMAYEGHLSFIKDEENRRLETEKCMELVYNTKNIIEDEGIEIHTISAGGTPTYKFTAKCPGITEIQPGTYVFMDSHYRFLVPEFEVSLTILSTVISKPTKRIATLDMGSKSVYVEGNPVFLVSDKIKVSLITEEHCQISCRGISINIGDKLQAIPPHVCPTVNLHDYYIVVEDDEIIGTWEISARGKVI